MIGLQGTLCKSSVASGLSQNLFLPIFFDPIEKKSYEESRIPLATGLQES